MIRNDQWYLGQLVYGCETLSDGVVVEAYGPVVEIRKDRVRIKYTEFNSGRFMEMKDCKPVCRELSTITEKEKEDLRDMLSLVDASRAEVHEVKLRDGEVKIRWCIFNAGNGNFTANTRQLHYLEKKGFFTGQYEEGDYLTAEQED